MPDWTRLILINDLFIWSQFCHVSLPRRIRRGLGRQLATKTEGRRINDLLFWSLPSTTLSQRRSLISIKDGQLLTICFWSQKRSQMKKNDHSATNSDGRKLTY